MIDKFSKLPKYESIVERVARVSRERAAFNRGMATKVPISDVDDFRGNNDLLRSSIAALLELDADNAIAPHGIGGHAKKLLAAAYHRLPQ